MYIIFTLFIIFYIIKVLLYRIVLLFVLHFLMYFHYLKSLYFDISLHHVQAEINYNTILIFQMEIISFVIVFTSIQCSATFFDFNNCTKLVNSLLLSLLTDFRAYSITSLLASSSGILFSMSSLIFLKKK